MPSLDVKKALAFQKMEIEMVKRLLFLVAWGLFLLGGLSGPSIAGYEGGDERILSFTSYIRVQPDASLTANETIVVRATGDQIKRGIVRDFPTAYKDHFGNKVTVGFRVLEVRRDGTTEPYQVKAAANGKKVYIGRLDYNPLREAERPREQANEQEERDKVAILTPAQITTFLEQVQDNKYQTLFLMGIMTGARQGELLGLKWGDINWKNEQIYSQRTFNKGRFFVPKTKGSRRYIDLSPVVVRELRKWRMACPANNLNLVFPNEAGGPMNYSNMVQRYFLPALKSADLPRFRFHDLRHTNASIRLANGENIKYIQTQLGHASPTITLNVYAHLMNPTNQDAACRLENAVFGSVGHHLGTKKEKGSRSKTVTP